MYNFVKRSLCVLCALLVAFTFAVRPHAIVGVDDAVLVGTSAVALLFLSWCGITFGTNADAVAGVQAYLENTVDGAKRLAAIAEQYVSDGTLKMTAAVKSAYMDLKDGIREFFASDDGSFSGSISVPSYFDVPSFDTKPSSNPANNYGVLITALQGCTLYIDGVPYIFSYTLTSGGSVARYLLTSSDGKVFYSANPTFTGMPISNYPKGVMWTDMVPTMVMSHVVNP